MASDDPEDADNGDEEEPSFKERLEEAREQGPDDEPMGAPGGAGGGPGGMGGNPFAQMMGGMMGGGGGMGGPGMQEEQRDTAVARELTQLREDVQELTGHVERIADALESE